MDNQEQESEREKTFKYAITIREKMEKESREQQEIERKRREEEEAKRITQSERIVGESKVNQMPVRSQLVEFDKQRVSIFDILNGLWYGFIIGAVGGALVVFLVAWGQAGFPNIEVWLEDEGVLIAMFVLIIAGLIGGVFGAPIGGAIAYSSKK